ncbi:MAG: hypothetical protein Unbinned15contig1001_39 [Prokaryotic dsDNA virus sp.]|nr:MAG: hypothetical protein Unbinned15contig1001_39 [Prokaryotic dsDNA virus sp.]|tara:strand:+ start:3226 stop:9573 length:6348 start_codon:yes stop_codon:yes gene_type:complete
MSSLQAYTNIARSLKAQYPHLRSQDDVTIATEAIANNPGKFTSFLPSITNNSANVMKNDPLSVSGPDKSSIILESTTDDDREREQARAYYNAKYQVDHDDYLLEARAKYEYGDNYTWKGVNSSNSIVTKPGPLKTPPFGEINAYYKNNSSGDSELESSYLTDQDVIDTTTSVVLTNQINNTYDPDEDYSPDVMDSLYYENDASGLEWFWGLWTESFKNIDEQVKMEVTGGQEILSAIDIIGRDTLNIGDAEGLDNAIERYERLNKLGQQLAQEQSEIRSKWTPDVDVELTYKRMATGTATIQEMQDFGKWMMAGIAFEAPRILIQLGVTALSFFTGNYVGAGLSGAKAVGGKKIKKAIGKEIDEKVKTTAEKLLAKQEIRDASFKASKRIGALYMGISASGAASASDDGDVNQIYKAAFMPVIDGAVEALSEKFELDVILKPLVKKQITRGGLTFLKNVGKAAATGAGSETLAQFGSNLNHKLWGEGTLLTEGLAEAATLGAVLDVGISGAVNTLAGVNNKFAKARADVAKNPNKKTVGALTESINSVNESVKENLTNKIVFGYNDGKHIAIEYDENGDVINTIEREDLTNLDDAKFVEELLKMQRLSNKDVFHFDINQKGTAVLDYHVYDPQLLIDEPLPKGVVRTSGTHDLARTRSKDTGINMNKVKGGHISTKGKNKGETKSGKSEVGMFNDVIDDMLDNTPMNTAKTKTLKKTIKALQRTFPSIFNEVKIVYKSSDSRVAGSFNPERNILLLTNTPTLETLLHEMIHGITLRAMYALERNAVNKGIISKAQDYTKDDGFTLDNLRQYFKDMSNADNEMAQLARLIEIYLNETGQDIFVQRFGNRMATLSQHYRKGTYDGDRLLSYGGAFMVEFVTEAFMDPAFQAEMSSIVMPQSKTQTLWNEFKALVRKIFGYGKLGKTTLLDETVDVILDLGNLGEMATKMPGRPTDNAYQQYLSDFNTIQQFNNHRNAIISVLRNFDSKIKGKQVYTIPKLLRKAKELGIKIPTEARTSRDAIYNAFLEQSNFQGIPLEQDILRTTARTDRIFDEVGTEKQRNKLRQLKINELLNVANKDLNEATFNSIYKQYKDNGNTLQDFEKEFIISAILFTRNKEPGANTEDLTKGARQYGKGIVSFKEAFVKKKPAKVEFKKDDIRRKTGIDKQDRSFLFDKAITEEKIQKEIKDLKDHFAGKFFGGKLPTLKELQDIARTYKKMPKNWRKLKKKELKKQMVKALETELRENQTLETEQEFTYDTKEIDIIKDAPYERQKSMRIIEVTRKDGVINNFIAIDLVKDDGTIDGPYYFPTEASTVGDALDSPSNALREFLRVDSDMKLTMFGEKELKLLKNLEENIDLTMQKEIAESLQEIKKFDDPGYLPQKTMAEEKPDELVIDTRIDLLGDEYEDAVSRPTLGIPTNEMFEKARGFFRFLIPSNLTTRIKAISPKAFLALMRFHQNEKLLLREFKLAFASFEQEFKTIKKTLKPKEAAEFIAATLNGDWATLKKFGISDEAITSTQEVFADIAQRLGFPSNINYFRREVVDYDGLVKYMEKSPTDALQSRFREALKKKRESNPKAILTPREKKNIIRSYLTDTKTHDALLQRRTVETVTPEMVKFYGNPISYMENYFSRAARISARSQFLGKGPQAVEISNGVFEINDRDGNDDATESDIINILIELLEDKSVLKTSTDKDGNPIVSLDTTSESYIKIKELVGLLKSAINYRPAGRLATRYRTMTSAVNILQPDTILLQLADIAISAVYNGIGAVAKSGKVIKGLTDRAGKALKLGLEEIGIEKYDIEFQEGMSNPGAKIKFGKKFEQGIIDLTKRLFAPLGGADFIGKSSLVKSVTIKYTNLAHNDPQKLYDILKDKWVDDTWIQGVINDLRKNVLSEDVKLLLYMEMAEFHPITTSDHIKFYIDNPWARPLLVLQSFAFKMCDRFGRQGVSLLLSGTENMIAGGRTNNEALKSVGEEQLKQGFKGTVQFIVLTLIIEQAVRKGIKELAQLAKVEPDEYEVEEIQEASIGTQYFKAIMGINPFFNGFEIVRLLETGDVDKFVNSFVNIAPFFGTRIIESMYKNMVLDKTKDKPHDFEWLRDIPLGGDILYGIEKRKKRLREL